jgi:hypothetical protein
MTDRWAGGSEAVCATGVAGRLWSGEAFTSITFASGAFAGEKASACEATGRLVGRIPIVSAAGFVSVSMPSAKAPGAAKGVTGRVF